MLYNKYIPSMRRFHWISLGVFALLAVVPLAVHADTIFNPIVSGECLCPGRAPDWGCVLQTFQAAMNDFVSFAVVIITLFIAQAGFTYMTSPTNPEKKQLANKRLLNAVIGLLIVLCAWLLIDSLMKVIYNQNSGFGPWNSILVSNGNDLCIQPRQAPSAMQALAQLSATNNGSGGSGAGGSCTVPANASNPCSAQSLSGTCFAASGANASQVCNYESSGGNPNISSGSDKLNGGSGPSYSIGLWQINLTTTPLQTSRGTLNCPAAFVGLNNPSNSVCGGGSGNKVGPSQLAYCNVAVKSDSQSQALYTACVAAAKDPAVNTQAACKLYNASSGGSTRGLQPWLNTSQKCNVPLHGT